MFERIESVSWITCIISLCRMLNMLLFYNVFICKVMSHFSFIENGAERGKWFLKRSCCFCFERKISLFNWMIRNIDINKLNILNINFLSPIPGLFISSLIPFSSYSLHRPTHQIVTLVCANYHNFHTDNELGKSLEKC